RLDGGAHLLRRAGAPRPPDPGPQRRADRAPHARRHAGPGERGVPGRGGARADGPAREGDDLLEPPTVADMRTGAYAPGAIETGILFVGVAQMARFYGVPCGGYIGLSNAKVNDAQSGFETGM